MKNFLLLLGMFVSVQLSAQITLIKKNESCAGRKDGKIEVMFDGNLIDPKYTWTKDGMPFAGGKIIQGLAPGDYAVTVTTNTGSCMAFKAAKVWPGPSFSVDISAHLIDVSPHPLPCGMRPTFTYELTATPRGGKPPYYCSWGNLDPGNGSCSVTVSGLSIRAAVFMSDSVGCGDSDGWEQKGVTKVCPRDPNDITGPEGYNSMRWVSVHEDMEYNVRFENDPFFATSNAASVFITVPIDDDIDPFSFRLGTMGFGSRIIEVPEHVSYFQQRIDYSQDLGIMLDVTAGLDLPNNRFFWLMTTIDPLTGQPPTDPTSGFLPVNDTLTGSGEGFINFVCTPKANTATGETVIHQASIVFDVNDPISTDTWVNTIDAFAPSTSYTPLADTFYTNQIPFTWMIEDDPGGCGVKYGEVLLSTDDVNFETQGFLSDSNNQTLDLEWGRTYYYKIRGIDFVDNIEVNTADSFYIVPQRAIEFLTPNREDYCLGDTLFIDIDLISLPDVDLYISTDSGSTYLPLALAVNTWPYAVVLDSSYLHPFIFLKARNESNNVEQYSVMFAVHTLPDIIIEGDPTTGCDGDILFVQGFGAYTWQWWPDSIIGTPDERYSNVYGDMSQYAWVRGTDVYGCHSIDSIWLTIKPISRDSFTQPLCEGDSLFINNEWITNEGFYETILTNSVGCDSIIVTQVYFESPCLWSHGPYVYVDKEATGANNGSSWADAFNELTDAIYVAGRYENVQEIWVAEGVYSPHASRRDTSFILRDSIKIFGGFLGIESTREERTSNAELVFLSGDINVPDTLWDNSYHTLQISESCVECTIDGVTIQYGYADQPNNTQDIGAGVLCKGKAQLSNVIFERNYATDLGAALHAAGPSSNLVIKECTFRLNTSSLGRDVVNLSGAQIEFRGANSIH